MTGVIRLFSLTMSMALIAGCTEPRPKPQVVAQPTALEARLELSDSLAAPGTIVEARVRIAGANASRIASFVDRVTYDSTGLRYVDDAPMADGATRVTNPVPGLIRSAGVRADGFTDGVLTVYRFEVQRSGALGSLRLAIDELHQVDHTDASPSLSVARAPVLHRP